MLGTKILEERTSKYNGHLRVLKTFGMGTYIQSNGLTQSGGIVESIWKSALRQIKNKQSLPLRGKKILILGLGGGTLAKLLRKKYPESTITGIEIDSLMIELGKKYLNLDDFNTEIIIKDVRKMKFKKNSFDLIIVDMYQGDNFPREFESEKFIESIKKALTKNGTIIINRLYFGDKRPDTVRFGNKLEKLFSKVKWFYPEANLMFICEP